MKIVFSNIFLTFFCKINPLQKYHNSKTFFNNAFLEKDVDNVLISFYSVIVFFLGSTSSLLIEKLPLITENGGIFSYNVR